MSIYRNLYSHIPVVSLYMLYFSMNLPTTCKHLNILVKSCIYASPFIYTSILSLFLGSVLLEVYEFY